MRFPRRVDIDFSQFLPNISKPEARYGLPRNVAFCSRCVISNQRPNSAIEFQHTSESQKATINFDSSGVCDACRVAEDKQNVDWRERERMLKDVCDRFRRNDGHYDCLVPGSGGKDSFYAAHILRTKYGMHPLTVTWAPHIYTEWGWRNFQSWIHAGFDNYLKTPNGRTHRLLTRLAVEKLFHPFQPFILGQKMLAPKMALLTGLKLVFYGENETEYGNPRGDMASARRDWKYYAASDKSQIYLGGVAVQELIERFGVDPVDLQAYLPPNPDELESNGVEVQYLGYYLKWHPQSCYYYAVDHGGFQASPERTPGTYSKYNSIDDRIDDFHYYTTYVKFGIGRATYDAAQEIRSDDLVREEGVSLVHRFDGEFPERFADEVFRYLSLEPAAFPEASKCFEQPIMDRTYFTHLADRFRSPHLWQYDKNEWKLRYTVWQDTPTGDNYRV